MNDTWTKKSPNGKDVTFTIIGSKDSGFVYSAKMVGRDITQTDNSHEELTREQVEVHFADYVDASVHQGFSVASEEFKHMVSSLRRFTEDIGLSETHKSEIDSHLSTVEAQTKSPNPKLDVVHTSLHSVKTILENAAGSLLVAPRRPHFCTIYQKCKAPSSLSE